MGGPTKSPAETRTFPGLIAVATGGMGALALLIGWTDEGLANKIGLLVILAIAASFLVVALIGSDDDIRDRP